MVRPCSFLLLLIALSAMVMVHGAPLSSKQRDDESKHSPDVSKLQQVPPRPNCVPGSVDAMCSPYSQAGVNPNPPPPPAEAMDSNNGQRGRFMGGGGMDMSIMSPGLIGHWLRLGLMGKPAKSA
ncbi:unnamed protein product [Absidia cylindrospora]